jgi:NAD-dependent dihydropyrimidine dehydrogenase PreA subunit
MIIDPQKCRLCNKCYNQCLNHGLTLISVHDVTFYFSNDNCKRCKKCADVCKYDAIEVNE